jgi:hypothetical protein
MSDTSFTLGDGIGCAGSALALAMVIVFFGFLLWDAQTHNDAFTTACSAVGGTPVIGTEIGDLCIRDGRLVEVSR